VIHPEGHDRHERVGRDFCLGPGLFSPAGQVAPERLVLRALEEPGFDVVLLEPRDVGPSGERPVLHRDRERAPERLEVAVDGGGDEAGLQLAGGVPLDPDRRDGRHLRPRAEVRD
jgi:hypothetical protein